MKTVFDLDSLDHSEYEKRVMSERPTDNHRKRTSSSMSPSVTLLDRKRSRNLSLVAPQSDKSCRYNGLNNPRDDPFGDEDDEVFEQSNVRNSQVQNTSIFAQPAPRTATSLWDLAPPMFFERKTSDTSGNGSFQERPKQILRAMSVGEIDSELPPTLEVVYFFDYFLKLSRKLLFRSTLFPVLIIHRESHKHSGVSHLLLYSWNFNVLEMISIRNTL